MVLFLNGREVCVSQAEYDHHTGFIQAMSDCHDGIPVKKGDYLTMTAIYDLSAHPPSGHGEGGHGHGGGMMEGGGDGGHMGGMGGEMGMWSIIFSPGGEAPAAEPPTSSGIRGFLSRIFGGLFED
jgi:hypothetical protein